MPSRKWLYLMPFLILIIGTTGFRLVEGWTWLDSFFMTVITLSTVGYGEVHQLDTLGKLLASGLIIVGVGTFSVIVSLTVQDIVVSTVFQDRRNLRRLKRMKNHYLVCGAGRVGLEIAHQLITEKHSYLIIEADTERIEELRDEGLNYLHGDATSEETLRQAGVDRAAGLACVLESDADNLFVCLTAREMNPNLYIVARSTSASSIRKLTKAGANKVLNPVSATALRMTYTLLKPNVVDFLEVASSTSTLELKIEEILIPEHSCLAGVRVADSELRQRENVIAAAIQKSDRRMVFNPTPSEIIEAGDILIALGSQESLAALAQRVNRS